MSRTRQGSQVKSPCEEFLKWSGSEGCWKSYDKETKQNIDIPHDIRFLFLDQLATITGFSDSMNAGLWSNEVRSTKRDKLMIHAGKNLVFTGLYADAKTAVQGAKYAQSVYALALLDGEYKLINLKLSGAALTAWITLQETVGGSRKLEGNVAVTVSGVEDKKKGATKFKVPIFETDKAETDEEEMAAAADEKLQAYLDEYLKLDKPNTQEEVEEEVEEDEEFFN